jgi:hypothetical protein
MNKKIIALVATLFIATSAQARCVYGDFNQTWPTVSLNALDIKAQADALAQPAYEKAFTQERNFQQNIQLAVLAGSGVVVATFFGCIFAEWLQEFKVRKAQKAKLIARLHCETREIQATCQAA